MYRPASWEWLIGLDLCFADGETTFSWVGIWRLTELPPPIWSFFDRYKLFPSLLLQFPCLKHQLILLKGRPQHFLFFFLEPSTHPCTHNVSSLKWAVMSAWVHAHWIKTSWKRTVPGWCVSVGSVVWVCWCWALAALWYCILWDGEESC